MVPFDRFDFHSSFPIQEIAKSNTWESEEEVYTNYLDTLLHEIAKPNENLEIFLLPSAEIEMLHTKVPKQYKTEPITHMGVNLERIKEGGRLKSMVENFSADYILFLCRYEIKSKMVATRALDDGSKFLAWSRHVLTYEMYNADGELVVLADQLELNPPSPNSKNASSHGTLLNEIKPTYEQIQEDIHKKLSLYRKKQRPIYKSR